MSKPCTAEKKFRDKFSRTLGVDLFRNLRERIWSADLKVESRGQNLVTELRHHLVHLTDGTKTLGYQFSDTSASNTAQPALVPVSRT